MYSIRPVRKVRQAISAEGWFNCGLDGGSGAGVKAGLAGHAVLRCG